jgi:prepilin-type N-terminal cleavage/methylation domain-containing protein
MKTILKGNQRKNGFTLVETLIAVAIIGIISTIIVSAVIQIIRISVDNKHHLEAVKQVENALYYLNRDAQMATLVDCEDETMSLGWTDIDGNSGTTVYSKVPEGSTYNLQRSNDGGNSIVARNIDNENTYWQSSGGIISVFIQVKRNSSSGTKPNVIRMMQIQPRLSQ